MNASSGKNAYKLTVVKIKSATAKVEATELTLRIMNDQIVGGLAIVVRPLLLA